MTTFQATFRGLTWNHPRGHDALAATAGDLIVWDTQPLEGFESHQTDDLCARYDLVVLDHPHLGEAVEAGCLTPLDELFADELAASIGPTMRSYVFEGRQRALPLDAATQVSAARADRAGRLGRGVDRSQRAGRALTGRAACIPVVHLDRRRARRGTRLSPDHLLSTGTGLAVLRLMESIDVHAPAETRALNPIKLLELMSAKPDASAVVRATLAGDLDHRRGLDRLQQIYRASHPEREKTS